MIAYFCLISCTQQQQQERVSNTFHLIWLILCSDRLPFHKFMMKICSSVIIILFFWFVHSESIQRCSQNIWMKGKTKKNSIYITGSDVIHSQIHML